MMGGILDDDANYGLDQSAVADVVNTAGVQGTVSVTTSAIEAKVGALKLVNRKLLTVFNDGSASVYWGYTNAVTAANGTPIFKSQIHSWDIGDSLSIWLIAAAGTHTCRVTEAS
jgi:hypothetical protein